MTKTTWIVLSFVLLAAAAGCGKSPDAPANAALPAAQEVLGADVVDVLVNGDKFELCSTDPFLPVWDSGIQAPIPDEYREKHGLDKLPNFQGQAIHGTCQPSAKDRMVLLDALFAGIVERDTDYAHCFWPRHLIRASKGSKTVDVLICFQCNGAQVYVSGQDKHKFFGPSKSPQAAFNAMLDKYSVPKPGR